jgi:hypothetical protein
MIWSSTACADTRIRKLLYRAVIGLLLAPSGCTLVAPNIETPAQVPAASVDPDSSLGSTASPPAPHTESENVLQTDSTPIDGTTT